MRSLDSDLTLSLEGVISLALTKQHLRAGVEGEDVRAVIDDLLGLHATVAPSPYLQLRARIPTFASGQLDALLDEGRAAKVACMRRTLFIVTAEIVPLVLAATRELTRRDRGRFLADSGLTWRRYEQMADRLTVALAGRALDARQLRNAVGAAGRLSPVIIVMCDEGRLVRWSGVRGWRGTQPRYRRFEEALPTVRLDDWEEDAAVRELADRYVRRYGPVTERDIAWWMGVPRATVRDAIAALPGLVRVGVDGLDGVFLLHEADMADAQRPSATPGGTVSLLPVLDPYLQGYRDRERFVAPRHRHFVIDSGGNATSVILVDGRAAGVWDLIAGHPPEMRLCYFGSVAARTRRLVHALATDVAMFLTGGTAIVSEVDRMIPLTDRSAGRFLSPLSAPGQASRTQIDAAAGTSAARRGHRDPCQSPTRRAQ